MTYRITSECIACHRCLSICPTGAITSHEHEYQINSERCNDCVGHYAVPQCWATCPTHGGCVAATTPPRSFTTSSSDDYWDAWFAIYDHLVDNLVAQLNNHRSDYWQQWFNRYSQLLANPLHPPISAEVTP